MRKVHRDKQGLYVVWDRRKFRPATPTTTFTEGMEAHTGYRPDKSVTELSLWTYDQSVRPWTHDRDETWHSTDVDPRIKERLANGQDQINVTTSRGQKVTVIVGDDGYDFRGYRRDVDPSTVKYGDERHSTRGVNVHFASRWPAQFTWDEWDDLCKQIEDARLIVPLSPITAQLEQEIALEDEFQAQVERIRALHGAIPNPTEP